ncbi:MAG TPA: Holliday junction resolvase RuvX [Candidatus Saccharimonadales bacterium]
MLNSDDSILALDVGGQRIGVAKANAIARIASPLRTIENGDDVMSVIQRIVQQEQVAVMVVGHPRGLSGQTTDQTRIVESFADALRKHLNIPVNMQDEAVTSQKAEDELKQRGKPYQKGDIDALAAVYILEDFLSDHPEVRA